MFEVVLVIFCVLAIAFFLGMIGDKVPENRKNFTYAFCTLAFAITALIIINIIFN